MKISGYVYQDGQFFEGTIHIDEGIIKEITRRIDREAPVKGVIIPKPHNAHAHLLDYVAKDLTEERDLLKLVAPPNGIKHKIISRASVNSLKDAINVASFLALKHHLGLVTEFRELGSKGVSLGKPSNIFRVLARPRTVEEARYLIDSTDGFNLSSISDVDHSFAKEISKIARLHKKIFGIHVSERIREDIKLVLDLEPTFIVHAIKATIKDLKEISEAEIPIVVCPRSNAYFGKLPRVDKMIELRIRVLLGTDNHMVNSINIFEEAEFLYKISRAFGMDIKGLEIIKMLFRDFNSDLSIHEGMRAKDIIVLEDLRGKPELIILNRHSSVNVYDLSSPRVAIRSA